MECGQDLGVRNGLSVAFPAVVAEDEGSGKEQLDVLETPEDQAMSRRIRPLHRQFGHVPVSVMVTMSTVMYRPRFRTRDLELNWLQ